MFENILVVDDDTISLKLIEGYLEGHDFNLHCYSSPVEALNKFKNMNFDLVISDYFMPDLNGDELLKEIRKINNFVPFIIFTVNTDIKDVINILKDGADDYILKPLIKEDLIYKINKTINDKNNKRISERTLKEKEILELDKKKLVDWKTLYAVKDITQTNQLIKILTRTINQGGSFIWLELLKNNIKKIDDSNYQISKNLVDLIIRTSQENQKFFDSIAYLDNVANAQLNTAKIKYNELIEKIIEYNNTELTQLALKYNRKIKYERSSIKSVKPNILIDFEYFKKIINELFLNAVKFSPNDSEILIGFEKSSMSADCIDITVRNYPKSLNVKDTEGNKIVGIPYDYSELVFDLFYTIEPYPSVLPEEEWTNGTGLYIARQFIKRFNGWIRCSNEIDYTLGKNEIRVKFIITLPLVEE